MYLCSLNGLAQTERNCAILKSFLNSDSAIKRFELNKNKDLTIVIVDTSNLFPKCQIDNIHDRKVAIVFDSLHISSMEQNVIFIYSVKKKGKNYIIEVHQKYTGSYGRVFLRKQKGKFIVTKFLVGFV
jgi:hypothetical protein